MYQVKLNVHPEDCDCPRSPNCRGKYVVNMPDTSLPNRTYRSYEAAEARIRELAAGGPPIGQAGVRGRVRQPQHARLMR
jgi:hypothetical protein